MDYSLGTIHNRAALSANELCNVLIVKFLHDDFKKRRLAIVVELAAPEHSYRITTIFKESNVF